MKQWYTWTPDGGRGPFTAEEIPGMARSGQVAPGQLLRAESTTRRSPVDGRGDGDERLSIDGHGQDGREPDEQPVSANDAAIMGDAADGWTPLRFVSALTLSARRGGPLATLAGIGKWCSLATAAGFCGLALAAEQTSATLEAVGLACFFVILARICQAEQFAPAALDPPAPTNETE